MLNEKRVMDLLVSPKLKNLFWVIFCHLSRKEEIKDRPISRQRQEFYHRESFNFVVGLAVMREDLLHSLQGLRYYYPATSRLRQKQKCWGKLKYFRPRRLATDLDVRNETIHKCTTKKRPWWNRRIQFKNCEDLNTTLCLLRPIDWLSLSLLLWPIYNALIGQQSSPHSLINQYLPSRSNFFQWSVTQCGRSDDQSRRSS